MKNSTYIILFFLIIALAFVLGFLSTLFEFGCINPKYELVKEYSIENYSCQTLEKAIITNSFLKLRDSNYVCGNIKTPFKIYYNRFEMRDEYERRCLN